MSWCHRHFLKLLSFQSLSCLSLHCVGCFLIEGILPKGPYLSCVSMVGRALLAGYPRYILLQPLLHMYIFYTHTHYSSSNVTHFIYSSIYSKCISLLHIPIVTNIAYLSFNKLRPRQNGQHFTDDILKCIFLKENIWILINILLNFVPVSRINNIPSLVQIMARRCRGASHYLNQWWLVYWHIYASLNLNELKVECSAYRESSELIKVGHGDTISCREYRDRFPRHRLQRKPLVNDPSMQHGTYVTHVPWCMLGSITHGSGENVPGIPPATRNFTYLARGPCIHV